MEIIECWHLCQECSSRWEHPSKDYRRMIVNEPFCIFKRFATCQSCLHTVAGRFLHDNIEEELYEHIVAEDPKEGEHEKPDHDGQGEA